MGHGAGNHLLGEVHVVALLVVLLYPGRSSWIPLVATDCRPSRAIVRVCAPLMPRVWIASVS
ncbi:hypothetical protein [Streptomyces sp. NPDC021212]|uniref:hypothetical protein n=1 Tax=Streptomyces sp. NPDC021212 TaxID=3365118 RepID=UPI0037A0722B